MSGRSEESVCAAVRRLLEEHSQRLSATEAELWTLEIVERQWAEKDPVRADELMVHLSEERRDTSLE